MARRSWVFVATLACSLGGLAGCQSKVASRSVTVEPSDHHPVASGSRAPEPSDEIDAVIVRASRTYGVDANLIRGVIWVESRFQPKARSPAGALGLMQLMPATARWLADELDVRARPLDPVFNVTAGTFYLSRMIAKFDGNVRLALAAYHAGPGNVAAWVRRGTYPAYAHKYVNAVLEATKRWQM